MNNEYKIEYLNEVKLKKLERFLRKYNMQAYKKLIFYYYPNLKEGKFDGKIIEQNNEASHTKYELELPADEIFKKIHGHISLIYTVNEKEKVIILETLNPENLLLEGSKNELTTYKGILVSKTSREKDIYKINLLNFLENNSRNSYDEIKSIPSTNTKSVKKVIKETEPKDNKETTIKESNIEQTKNNETKTLKEKIKTIWIIYLILTTLIALISLIIKIYE